MYHILREMPIFEKQNINAKQTHETNIALFKSCHAENAIQKTNTTLGLMQL